MKRQNTPMYVMTDPKHRDIRAMVRVHHDGTRAFGRRGGWLSLLFWYAGEESRLSSDGITIG
jgi:hypothetical protein